MLQSVLAKLSSIHLSIVFFSLKCFICSCGNQVKKDLVLLGGVFKKSAVRVFG